MYVMSLEDTLNSYYSSFCDWLKNVGYRGHYRNVIIMQAVITMVIIISILTIMLMIAIIIRKHFFLAFVKLFMHSNAKS
jgi:uncharacterized membrane protein (UPF0182 family)